VSLARSTAGNAGYPGPEATGLFLRSHQRYDLSGRNPWERQKLVFRSRQHVRIAASMADCFAVFCLSAGCYWRVESDSDTTRRPLHTRQESFLRTLFQ